MYICSAFYKNTNAGGKIMAVYKCEHCGHGVCMHGAQEPVYCPYCKKAMIKTHSWGVILHEGLYI